MYKVTQRETLRNTIKQKTNSKQTILFYKLNTNTIR